MTTCRLAMAQILVEPGEVERNLSRALDAIDQATESAAEVVVLPECLDVGWTELSARRLAEPIPGSRSDRLCAAARSGGLYVVAGLTERDGARIFNAAVLCSPRGELVLRHRKISELDIARPLYSVGSQLSVAETRFGRVAVNICADNLPGSLELGHAQGRMGAVALWSPCSWAVPPAYDPALEPYDTWDAPYRELALAHRMAVVGVSNVGGVRSGPWAGYSCIGCSLAVGVDGEVLARASYGAEASEMVIIDLELRDGRVS